MKNTLLLASALTTLSALASAQTYTQICFESFDYPAGSLDTLNGATGWGTAWTGFNATVTAPGTPWNRKGRAVDFAMSLVMTGK